MKRTVAIAALVFGSMLVSPVADARQTISRPIDNFLGNWLDHTYTGWANNVDCYESFGGGCDCAGSSSCYAYQNGDTAGSCSESYFDANWTYGSNGVCHQATNNVAWYWGGPGGITSPNIRGMGISTGMFGNWGSPDNC